MYKLHQLKSFKVFTEVCTSTTTFSTTYTFSTKQIYIFLMHYLCECVKQYRSVFIRLSVSISLFCLKMIDFILFLSYIPISQILKGLIWSDRSWVISHFQNWCGLISEIYNLTKHIYIYIHVFLNFVLKWLMLYLSWFRLSINICIRYACVLCVFLMKTVYLIRSIVQGGKINL